MPSLSNLLATPALSEKRPDFAPRSGQHTFQATWAALSYNPNLFAIARAATSISLLVAFGCALIHSCFCCAYSRQLPFITRKFVLTVPRRLGTWLKLMPRKQRRAAGAHRAAK